MSPPGELRSGDGTPTIPAVQCREKRTDSAMAAKMSFVARAGHPCGADFTAADFLERHPEFSWQKPLLRDMKAGPWTVFSSGQKP